MQSSHSLERVLPGVVPSQTEPDDAQLVQASQQGDQNAFALLVQRHQRRIFTMSLRMLQDYDEASDITQEAFLAAWQGLPLFRGDARFPTWLYRIAYNGCLLQLELRKRERALQAAVQAEEMPTGVDDEKQVIESIEKQDRQAIVREHLEKLPAMYRMVLILRYLQDRTYKEMADILTMPIGTIKTHLFRARHLLKERLLAQHLSSPT